MISIGCVVQNTLSKCVARFVATKELDMPLSCVCCVLLALK